MSLRYVLALGYAVSRTFWVKDILPLGRLVSRTCHLYNVSSPERIVSMTLRLQKVSASGFASRTFRFQKKRSSPDASSLERVVSVTLHLQNVSPPYRFVFRTFRLQNSSSHRSWSSVVLTTPSSSPVVMILARCVPSRFVPVIFYVMTCFEKILRNQSVFLLKSLNLSNINI